MSSVHTDEEATPAKEQEAMRTEWRASLEPNWRACRCSLSRVRCDFQVRKGLPAAGFSSRLCEWAMKGSLWNGGQFRTRQLWFGAVKGWKDRWTVPPRGARIPPAYSAGTCSWCQACLNGLLTVSSILAPVIHSDWPLLHVQHWNYIQRVKETIAIFPPEN